ncbi:MAG: dihydrodipicolinate reductase C-terminal domain-containing protein [Candidatus Binataceae bacterium]
MIAEARGLELKATAVFSRESISALRKPDQIAIFGLRAGDAVDDHTVYFGGQGERLELSHRSQSRESLARGALRAAEWIENRPPGLYSMHDMLGL